MNTLSQPDTEELLRLADEGDAAVVQALFDRHRGRLKQVIAVRMDPRLARRFDPSDIVQETLLDAHRNLGDYLRDRPLPFFAWLRQIA